MTVGVHGGFFQLAAGLIQKLLGLRRVIAELVFVCILRCVDLVKRLSNVVLSVGKVRMPGGIYVRGGPLGKGHAHEGQAENKHEHRKKYMVFRFIVSLLFFSEKTMWDQERFGWARAQMLRAR